MVTFKEHILPLFRPYANAMRNIQVASEDGVEPAMLDDYDFVKRFHNRILARLKGVNEFGQSVPVMPPSGKLPEAKIKLFEDWIAGGMLEGGAGAV